LGVPLHKTGEVVAQIMHNESQETREANIKPLFIFAKKFIGAYNSG
jgi:hypothetical protein